MKDDVFRFVFNKRGILLALPCITMLFVSWNMCRNDLVVWGGGGAVVLLGILVRIWGQSYIKRRLGYRGLVTTGPYGYMRNPLYVGNILILTGMCVCSKLIWLVPAVFVWSFLVYDLSVRWEENELYQKFGENYAEYKRNVGRWLPGRASFSAPQEFALDMSVIKKEAAHFLVFLPFIGKDLFFRL